jgi:hypothetical protein
MSNSTSDIMKASSAKVAGIMAVGETPARVWRPDELAAVFRHQMAAPVSVDLAALDPTLSGQLRVLSNATGLLLKSFNELLHHPNPPLELLRMVKDFAKLNRDRSESLLPGEVATVLYYLTIAAALVRLDERITTLSDHELKCGFIWAIEQKWIDDPARELLGLAEGKLPGTTGPV